MRFTLIEDSPETLISLLNAFSERSEILEIQFIKTAPFFDSAIEQKIQEFNPNLIILDLLLYEGPDSGFRVLARLKESELLKNVPVVVCSKYIDDEQDFGRKCKQKAIQLGAQAVFTKIPFPLAEDFLPYVKQDVLSR